MSLPPLDQRATPVLVEEKKRLTDARNKVSEIARDLNMEPYFAEPIERIDEACAEIEIEISRRNNP